MAQQLSVTFESAPIREVHVDPNTQSPANVVVETIADLEGVDPVELPPLGNAIDPTVINRLLVADQYNTGSPAVFCFSFCGWEVFVRSDGTFVIGDPAATTTSTPLF